MEDKKPVMVAQAAGIPQAELLAAASLLVAHGWRVGGPGGEDIAVLQMDAGALSPPATTFEIVPYSDRRHFKCIRQMQVVKRSFGDHPEAWAIVDDHGSCLYKDGIWGYEPRPSSRTDEFFAQTRWPTALEAIAFAQAHLKAFPTGFNPEQFKSDR